MPPKKLNCSGNCLHGKLYSYKKKELLFRAQMAITALTECQKCVAYKIFLASHGLSFGCALHVHSVSHRMSTTIYCRLSIVGENYGRKIRGNDRLRIPRRSRENCSVLKMHCQFYLNELLILDAVNSKVIYLVGVVQML